MPAASSEWADRLAGNADLAAAHLRRQRRWPLTIPTTREIPLDPHGLGASCSSTCRISAVRREGGEFKDVPDAEIAEQIRLVFRAAARAVAIPNMQRLQDGVPQGRGSRCCYTTIESLTKDGRDRSLDYKITGFNVPKGSWDGKVIDETGAAARTRSCCPKSSSSVFVSTHIDYILRNLGVKQLVLCGLVTDQCVESAVRDACDLGYLVNARAGCLRHLSAGAARHFAARDQGLLPAESRPTP